MLTVTYAECHLKAPHAECHYAEYRYAECHGAKLPSANSLALLSSVSDCEEKSITTFTL
jgi:hypothetical protein